MNVSMMDAYNLAWKLAHSINGLTPKVDKGVVDPVLTTFNAERVETARLLINFDKRFSHLFSGKIGAQDASAQGLSQDEFRQVFSEGSGFTSGCSLHYSPSSVVVEDAASPFASSPRDVKDTHLIPGRRLLNVELKRYSDGSIRQLHDGKVSLSRNCDQYVLTLPPRRDRVLWPLRSACLREQRLAQSQRDVPDNTYFSGSFTGKMSRGRYRPLRHTPLSATI